MRSIYNRAVFPSNRSEFEIQAVCFFLLHKAGYLVRGEVKITLKGKEKNCRCGRFDLVIFNHDTKSMVLVIEVKKIGSLMCSNSGSSYPDQIERYEEMSGCPCFLVCGIKEANEIIGRMERRFPDILQYKTKWKIP
ncbi:type I restriction enzyme HsdR N-terminal domain-containing protein [Candidatus Pacearchaeota archaeon]|nr:type I restriction enzyme HsdR N-terminal domain-containing protein [Candidatus Pacearchaeota archaeon]